MIKSFTELIVWQKAHILTLKVYKITKLFPKDEIFCLTSQIRRAVISVESNIAEGFSRKSAKESRQFYYIAKSSLEEVKCQIIISKDIGYINIKDYKILMNDAEEVSKLINYWIKK